MKDKVIFWLDVDLEHFGIAKSFQEKHDCDIFAVIDINDKAKKFFQDQQIVSFKKVWYYRDHISIDKKPDIDYLESFEKKYQINLWSLAYTERYFFKYNQYYKFNDNEILSLLEKECKFFESILDEIKPDYLLIKVTDYHQNHLMHQICKARGIKILMYGRTRIGYRTMISTDCDIIDDNPDGDDFHESIKSVEELQNYIKGYSNQQSEFRKENRTLLWKRLSAGLQFLLFVCNNDYRRFYANYGRTRLRVLINEGSFLLKRWYREDFLNKHSITKIDDCVPFVYFPLHLEPERALLIAAPFYTNQLEVIVSIAKSLPVEYKLCVKDHPGMRDGGWRETSFYKKILELPNVELVHHSISNDELIKKCSLVVTIAGSAGMEAAFYQKPSIVLADVIYSSLPSVHRLKNIEDLPYAIRTSLQKKVNLVDLNKYISYVEKNSFEFDYFGLQASIGNTFFHGGFLKDVEIPVQKMKEFLDENKSSFDKLADEHIKKIAHHKQYETNTKRN